MPAHSLQLRYRLILIGKKIICVKTMCPVTFTCHDLRMKCSNHATFHPLFVLDSRNNRETCLLFIQSVVHVILQTWS